MSWTKLQKFTTTLLAVGVPLLWGALAYAAPRITVSEKKIQLNESINFPSGTALIPATSTEFLDEIAQTLDENPRFEKIVIEGYTDSQGDAEKNRALSAERAAAVREALISRGIAATRLRSAGFGPDRPIADNATASGRAKNRRVVLNVLQASKRKRPPVAKITGVRNEVGTREPLKEDWKPAKVGLGLHRSWRVKTEEKSGANLTFRDESTIEMQEQTLVVIYGASTEKSRVITHRAELETGSLRSWLQKGNEKQSQLIVQSPAGDALLTEGSTLIAATGKKSTISNFDGADIELFGKEKSGKRGKKAVRIKNGFGSRVKKGSKPEAPRKLPPAPKFRDDNVRVALIVGSDAKGEVAAAWSPEPKAVGGYQVELRPIRDGKPQEAVRLKTAATQFRIEQLPPGIYEARVSSIDDIGLESVPSPPLQFKVAKVAFLRGGSDKVEQEPEQPNGGGKDTALALMAGDQINYPSEVQCSVDGENYVVASVTVTTNAKVLQCRNIAVPGKPILEQPLAVGLYKLDVTPPHLSYSGVSEVRVGFNPRITDLPSVNLEADGVTVGEKLSVDSRTGSFDVFITRPQRNQGAVVLKATRHGIVLAETTLRLPADTTPPTIDSVSVTREDNGISVVATVTDDVSGPGVVTAYLDDMQKQVVLIRGEDGRSYSGTIATAPEDGATPMAHVTAYDRALNGPVESTALVPGKEPPSALWYAAPFLAAAPAAIAGGVLWADASLFLFGQTPPIGQRATNLAERQVDAQTIALTEVFLGTGALLFATVVAAGGTAAVYAWRNGDLE